ncbi:MAG: hypothetical protein RIN56_08425 [Sporomusaceae bacterium]|nr:hypothetical protein [Sporomusaceae bacterium]
MLIFILLRHNSFSLSQKIIGFPLKIAFSPAKKTIFSVCHGEGLVLSPGLVYLEGAQARDRLLAN